MDFFSILGIFLLAFTLAFGARTDDGNGLDPHGSPRVSSAQCGDEGNGLDPHGGRCTE